MRSLLGALTTRGVSFLAAGVAAVLVGLALSERELVTVGAMLVVLPLCCALAASRARYRLSCVRSVTPPRVSAGQTARVRLRLENVSRLPTGLLLAEDTVPYALGTRPRYVLNGIERGGIRELSYPLRSDLRGKFVIGPLEIRIADPFGLVELGRSFSSQTTLVVTPRVVPLSRVSVTGTWLGEGDGRTRAAAAAGDDDVIPRAYRDGDELRRVHWRSTARYGQLMVRREEQRWRNRAMLLLDTRRSAHSGTGATSSFEFAVSAAASIGVHLAREGLDGELITDAGAISTAGIFEDVLLDSLAVIKPSHNRDLGTGISALRGGSSGMIIAITGQLSASAARQLAASRRDAGPAIAVLLAVSTWGSSGRPPRAEGPARQGATNGGSNGRLPAAEGDNGQSGPSQSGQGPGQDAPSRGSSGRGKGGQEETGPAAAILRAAGWRVVAIDADTPLAAAWQQLAVLAIMPGTRTGPTKMGGAAS